MLIDVCPRASFGSTLIAAYSDSYNTPGSFMRLARSATVTVIRLADRGQKQRPAQCGTQRPGRRIENT
eukprot:10234929-Heterocapsa_arctica.AAC.1